MRRIGQTLLNLDDVFLATGADGVRRVTDRFVVWEFEMLPRGAKIVEVLRHVPDGAYTLTAGGVVRAHYRFTDVPTIERVMPTEVGDALRPLPIVVDHKHHGARLYISDTGCVTGIDTRLDLTGMNLHLGERNLSYKPIVATIDDHIVGGVMPVRIADDTRAEIQACAEAFRGAVKVA